MTSNRLPGARWISTKLSTITAKISGMIWARRRTTMRRTLVLRSAIEPDFGPAFTHEVRGGGVITDIGASNRHRLEIHHRQDRCLDTGQTIEIPRQRDALRLLGFNRHLGDDLVDLGVGIAGGVSERGAFDDAVGRIILRRA